MLHALPHFSVFDIKPVFYPASCALQRGSKYLQCEHGQGDAEGKPLWLGLAAWVGAPGTGTWSGLSMLRRDKCWVKRLYRHLRKGSYEIFITDFHVRLSLLRGTTGFNNYLFL